jgi:hypothetical protein
MKIKFVANYDNDLNIYKSILNCFKLTQQEKQMLTYEEHYEYLGIFNGYRGEIKTKRDNVFGFLQEPIGNINYDRNLHHYCKKIFCQSSEMFKPNTGVIENHLCMFYSSHTTYHHTNFDDNFNKPKNLCIFMSGISSPNNSKWVNSNYSKRLNLLNKILSSDLDIDIYGRGLNIADSRYKGSPDNKHEILKQYRYSIAIENCCENNYVSEKFFDCILNNTVPLYYGCPNIDKIFNSASYETLDLDNKNIIQDIKNLILNDNFKYKNSILEDKEKYFTNFNPLYAIQKNINQGNI